MCSEELEQFIQKIKRRARSYLKQKWIRSRHNSSKWWMYLPMMAIKHQSIQYYILTPKYFRCRIFMFLSISPLYTFHRIFWMQLRLRFNKSSNRWLSEPINKIQCNHLMEPCLPCICKSMKAPHIYQTDSRQEWTIIIYQTNKIVQRS